MLRSTKDLTRYAILATDGQEVGNIDAFYFDDRSWTIRHIVVDVGSWLAEERVLLSPHAVGQPDWQTKSLPVQLSREEVEQSPPADLREPVSAQRDKALREELAGVAALETDQDDPDRLPGSALPEVKGETATGVADPHLLSTEEVLGYRIQARDGEIGHVADMVADDETWTIQYLVVDTGEWLPGKKVLVAPAWIQEVRWSEQKVHVDLQRQTVKDSPAFDPNAPVNREYEVRLYDYYGRPRYWD
jgi:sporulation protein YlmC with PRC-barrel domain